MKEQRIALIVMIIAILVGLLGCAPRVLVTPNPSPQTQGIRYYRPKPYLKVVPAEISVGKDATDIQPSLVTVTLEYLPDFSEEYAIEVKPGLGIANVSVKLEDGWNLTEISQELDSQTDENISAMADVLKAASGIIPTSKRADETTSQFTVAATNVPLGYYEAVLGCGPDGKKRLYGFRYLGFLPYEPCPTTMGGSVQACCNDPFVSLYGLTFENGRMVFKSLEAMQAPAQEDVRPVSRSNSNPPLKPVHVAPAKRRSPAATASEVEQLLLRELTPTSTDLQRVTAAWSDAPGGPQLSVIIFTSSPSEQARIQRRAEETLAAFANGTFLYVVSTQLAPSVDGRGAEKGVRTQ